VRWGKGASVAEHQASGNRHWALGNSDNNSDGDGNNDI